VESVETVKNDLTTLADELGWKLEFAQANGSPATARTAAQTLLQKNVDGILNVAVENTALTSVIDQAQSKGIPFVSQFVGATEGLVDISPSVAIDTSNMTDLFLKQINNEGEIAIISSSVIPALRERTEQFKKYVSERAPNVDIVEEHELSFEPSATIDARNTATAFLSQHPDLKGIWTSFDEPAAGAALAVEKAGKTGEVIVTGYDGDSVFVEKMGPTGAGTATVRNNYEGVSQQGLWAVNELMRGKYVPRGISFSDPLMTKKNVSEVDTLVGDGIVPCSELVNPPDKEACTNAVNVNGEEVPVPAGDQ
jgi:ribose transport system substrate-binding protein